MRMHHLRLAGTVALTGLLSAGCLFGGAGDEPAAPTTTSRPDTPPDTSSDPTVTPASTPGSDPTPGSVPSSAPTTAKVAAPAAGGTEPNVIKGVIRDEQGDPVAGAVVRIVGYTGNPTGLVGADHDEEATTDGNGAYRLQPPSGLYDIHATATVPYDGKTFKEFYLHPADGNCEAQMSAPGIVKDFVLRLTGQIRCIDGPDPTNAGLYSGGPIDLFYQSPRSLPADTQLTFTLTPTAALADGSPGTALTFTRTVAHLANGSGPLETTGTLHDIPLGRYQLTGFATLPGGARQELRFGPWDGTTATPAASYAVSFRANQLYPYGIQRLGVSLYDAGSGGAAPAPDPAPNPTPAPDPTTTTTTGQVCGEYWGCL